MYEPEKYEESKFRSRIEILLTYAAFLLVAIPCMCLAGWNAKDIAGCVIDPFK
jgi:hypothetical protein